MHNPVDKMAFLGFLAGVWVGFGGIAATAVGGGIPIAIRAEWPVLPRLGLAFFFPFALVRKRRYRMIAHISELIFRHSALYPSLRW